MQVGVEREKMESASCNISFPQCPPKSVEPDPCKTNSPKLLLTCHFKDGLQEQFNLFSKIRILTSAK